MWSSNGRCSAAATGSLLALALGLAAPATAAVDLAAVQVLPQRGQSPDQVRRDRYECHNWAVEQTGSVPLAAPQGEAAQAVTKESERAARAERWNRVLAGAAIGAGVGGLIGSAQDHHHDAGDEVLAGAAVGAVIGAATGRPKQPESGGEDPESSDYLRALTACLEGRGYTVALPGAPSDDEEAEASASSPRPRVTPVVVANASASAASTKG